MAHSNSSSSSPNVATQKNGLKNEVSRQEIQAAVAKAVELRALHAALLQGSGGSTATNLKFPSSSPVSLHSHQFSAHDYPVFTPSYEDDPPSGYQQLQLGNHNYPDTWEDYCLGGGNGDDTSSDYRKANTSSRNGFTSNLANLDADDQKSVTGSTVNNHVNATRASPNATFCKSRRNSLGDLNSVSSGNKYRPFSTSAEIDAAIRSGKSSNIVFPLTDSHSGVQSQPKNKGLNLSWLFPRLKKKNKNVNSPNRSESEDANTVMVDTLKRELFEVSARRDAALMEVSEMKSSVGDLHKKLEYLETYCEELKKALGQAAQTKTSHNEKLGHLPKKGKSIDGDGDNLMPVSEEVMVEGFLQIVAEARLSVKQFCKTLLFQIEETDKTLVDNLNSLLQPYKLSLDSKYSKAVLYHLEAIINQTLYQDFENCVFQKSGAPKQLDPQQCRHAQFSSFVALRNLSWNEVLRKGTKYYSEDFSKFCDHKMSGIISSLSWTRPWPEQLLQAFFVAAKCIWLLHLLAFSFGPPLGILRVDENRGFDQQYMEDIFADKQKSRGASKVKVMVMPGFYVHDRVLRCKVLCRYKSTA